MANDPTYDRAAIDADPAWRLAFILSELLNDNAPIGWGRYILAAETLLGEHVDWKPERGDG